MFEKFGQSTCMCYDFWLNNNIKIVSDIFEVKKRIIICHLLLADWKMNFFQSNVIKTSKSAFDYFDKIYSTEHSKPKNIIVTAYILIYYLIHFNFRTFYFSISDLIFEKLHSCKKVFKPKSTKNNAHKY